DVSSLKDCLSAAATNPEQARRKGALALNLARRMSWARSAAMTGRLIARTGERPAGGQPIAVTSTMHGS
ncbi:MAG: hypothetical protein M3O61_03235, partial [Gemmatimonadota bacterium]|nr:hypothetical protein [Gemmatimonadota bacterium]